MEVRTAGFLPGQIVTAVAGRETGCRFMILSLDERFLYLADGKKRTADRPKAKNPSHVRPFSGLGARNILPPGSVPTDEMIRQAIKAIDEES